jgi:hypothetical protein
VTNDLMLGGVYLLMAVMLVLGSLMARREPAARKLTLALAWIAIFAGGFVVLTFRDDLGLVAQRLRAEDGRSGRAGCRNPHPDGHRRSFLDPRPDQRRAGQVPVR